MKMSNKRTHASNGGHISENYDNGGCRSKKQKTLLIQKIKKNKKKSKLILKTKTPFEQYYERESKGWMEKQEQRHGYTSIENLLKLYLKNNITGIIKIIVEYYQFLYLQTLSTFRMMPVNMRWNKDEEATILGQWEDSHGTVLKFNDGSIRVNLKDHNITWL